jgi:three-Cys-motif partner protein
MKISKENIIHFDPLINVTDDGLLIPEVRRWSLEKYKLVGSYCDIFSTGMKNLWEQRIYIDLFAGAGFSKISETGKIYKSSALIAMSIPNPFTKYILCEQDTERYEALKVRVERDYSHLNCEILNCDSNSNVEQIIAAIPEYNKGDKLLSFCFVDPFSLNLHFSTIRRLANKFMDFLILQALHMDANRNFDNYNKEENQKISNYLGLENWREIFEKDGCLNRKDFVKFLADQYQLQMAKLNYIPAKNMHQVHSTEKKLPLYYLSFYSRHKRGEDFFHKVQNRVQPQLKLEF